jgi:hypothetical protein
MANGIESGAEEETEAPPEQPPGDEDNPHVPHALDESPSDEEGAEDKVNIQPADDESDGSTKPGFLVKFKDPPDTAKRVAVLLAEQFDVYQRGGRLVSIWDDDARGRAAAKELSAGDVTAAVHEVVQPYVIKKSSRGPRREEIALPDRVAKLCLSNVVMEMMQPLRGIAYSPSVEPDGSIHDSDGYNPGTGIFFYNLPKVDVPERPTRQEAEAAFRRLRIRLRTFPFADSIRVQEEGLAETVVDMSKSPGADETACITGVVTAVSRPSLDLVPGLLITAPRTSGAGTGKGKLVRFISEVAFGMKPCALTPGHDSSEMDKRLSSEFMTATPIILLDNVNGRALESNLLASAMTENPAQVRLMRTNTMVRLNPSVFMCVTGNGLIPTEDLVRRFLVVELDAGVESPEARSFEGDFLAEAQQDRASIVSDVLTIIRWGLQQGNSLQRGRPLGSFEDWCRLCRDPIMALSGRDPVVDIANRQAHDPQRAEMAELFKTWERHHGDREMECCELHADVWDLLVPGTATRQRVAPRLKELKNTTCNGFRLRQIVLTGKWTAYRYKLERINGQKTDDSNDGGQTRPPPTRRM